METSTFIIDASDIEEQRKKKLKEQGTCTCIIYYAKYFLMLSVTHQVCKFR